MHGLLICLLFAGYRRILTRFRSTQIAPSISYSVVTISAPCRCLSRVTQESLILDIQRVACGVKRLLRHSVYNNGYFNVAFFPSEEYDLSFFFVVTYLLYVVHFATSSEWQNDLGTGEDSEGNCGGFIELLYHCLPAR